MQLAVAHASVRACAVCLCADVVLLFCCIFVFLQAESRESLPAIPLKTAFTANMQQGKLVDPKDSAR